MKKRANKSNSKNYMMVFKTIKFGYTYVIGHLAAILCCMNIHASSSSLPPKIEGERGLFQSKTGKDVIYSLDFSENLKTEDPRTWLTKKGFSLESAAKNQNSLKLSLKRKTLILETQKKIFGLIINPDLHLENAKRIRITWGVNRFPEGASYEKGINNEAVMVYVYYGKTRFDSGNIFIPSSPYFIGLFLGEYDKANKPYTGAHFMETGKFICLANPELNKTVVSEFDLQAGFKDCFGKDKDVPAISGIALEVETSNSSGTAKAFIKEIEILK